MLGGDSGGVIPLRCSFAGGGSTASKKGSLSVESASIVGESAEKKAKLSSALSWKRVIVTAKSAVSGSMGAR